MRAFFSLISQFVPLIVTFVLAGASYWLAAQSEIDLFGLSKKADSTTIDSYINQFNLQSKDFKNNTVSMLQGQRAEHHPANDTWVISTPRIQRVQADGGLLTGQADQALYMPKNDRIDLNQNVRIHSVSGGVPTDIETAHLEIDQSKNTVSTRFPVKGTRPGQTFTANGVVMNQTTGEIETQGNTNIRIEAKP